MPRIPLAKPAFDDEMREAAVQPLQNEKFVLGESVYKFEEEFARHCGTKFAISTASGTAALVLALLALRINSKQVVTSPASFVASANAVLFTNLLFIDEINRNTPKTNSAILEAMQEKQVTIEGQTEQLPSAFMVIAEPSRVFPLPEVLIDRFLLSLKVDYPSVKEEVEIADRIYSIESEQIRRVTTSDQISDLAELAKQVYIAPQVKSYIVELVQRTRETTGISLGASPRASIALTKASRALALVKGRMYVILDDVKQLAPKVLSHRIVLSPAERPELSPRALVAETLEQTPIPQKQS